MAKKSPAKPAPKKSAPSRKPAATNPAKKVFAFGAGKAEGRGLAKDILGGKGQGLAEMVSIGLPVPPGFTLSIPACAEYYARGKKLDAATKDEVVRHVAQLEKTAKRKFGDARDPLLVSVRSGAASSMPGMMETILNLGLNDISVEGFAQKTNNPRFAYDSYRRFIQMYATTAMGLSKKPMEDMLSKKKAELGVETDPEIPAEALKELCNEFKAYYKKEMNGQPFPQDPMEQLWGAIMAVFNSWEAEKAVEYRRAERLTGLQGTAVNVQQMVFGNMGDSSGTGVCFTRDPSTGENKFFGECLINAQGEDVVAGIRTPLHLDELANAFPKAYKELCAIRLFLEKHYRDMQDMEFTIQEEKLYMLQCRSGKRAPQAAFKMVIDMVKEKLITKEEGIERINASHIERMFAKVIAPSEKPKLKGALLGQGLNAVPGAAVGQLRFSAADAARAHAEGTPVILIREETSPEDIGGMVVAQGILTARGGMTSHAAVVARGWGKCCVVGAGALEIDEHAKTATIGKTTLREGDWVTVDGSSGQFYVGQLELVDPVPTPEFHQVMKWCDQIRRIGVRTNADSPEDAQKAIDMGAEGIGLCRTEHMFFATEARRLAMQEMILADSVDARKAALDKLLPFQREDFTGIFRAMNGKPVTIRLIDPPLHEFTPKTDDQVALLAKATGVSPERIRQRSEQLHEANPMLGHRGCRLCMTYPEILDMQVTAIIEAAIAVAKAGGKVYPEIMIPLTMAPKEFTLLEARARAVADALIKASGKKVAYLVGTMIEIPRAALLADQIAERAEFFSFGTNDLTQMTMGLSRDDAGQFLPEYLDAKRSGVFKDDPFMTLDQEGVGQLVKVGIERGRAARPGLKIGVCGEHGGDVASVIFFAQAGMNYVSASPYRVPVARLAAAQAAIRMDACACGCACDAKASKKSKAPVAKKASAQKAPAKKR